MQTIIIHRLEKEGAKERRYLGIEVCQFDLVRYPDWVLLCWNPEWLTYDVHAGLLFSMGALFEM